MSTYAEIPVPREIIAHCARAGIEVTYDMIRKGYARFGSEYTRRLRRRQPQAADK
ncbi:hypothetical protein ACFVWF_28370 [Rhodococcus qingshengii]|uniref:hypothetical protein n=1 Tax=Rhodococcus qingshengii TaxID=334542 RepID=UPI0036DB913A